METKFIKEDHIATPIGRLSWVFIHDEDPKQNPGDMAKHKLSIMLPKNKAALESLGLNAKQEAAVIADVAQFVEQFTAEAKTVAEAKFKGKYKGTRWNPLLDGDSDQLSTAWEGNKNYWILRCKSKFKPTVIDRKKNKIETDNDPEGIYSGCWGKIHVSLYAYDVDGNKGVASGLGFFIKKMFNDEAFTSGGNVDEAFDEDDDEFDDVEEAGDEFDDDEELA